MSVQHVDVTVMGGGPAGTISAAKLAEKGFSVILVDPDKTASRLEGIGERLMQWFKTEGLGEDLHKMSELVPRLAFWGGLKSQANHEYLINRQNLDRLLRTYAQNKGVLVKKATAQIIQTSDLTSLKLSTGKQITSRYVIDARGRSAHSNKNVLRGPSTLAIGGWFENARYQTADTQLVPYRDGWVWLARMGDGRLWAQITLDALAMSGTAEQNLISALHSTEPDTSIKPETAPIDLVIRECAPVILQESINPKIIPAGDAAAGMDPLSGHGMFWAVSSALSAIASIQTMEKFPTKKSADLVKEFMGKRNRETYKHQARLGRDFLRQEKRFQEAPFWKNRLNFPDDEIMHEVCETSIKSTIVIENGFLVEKEILVTQQEPSGVAWFDGIPVVEAFRLLEKGYDVNDFIQKWGEIVGRRIYIWLKNRTIESA